MNDIGHAVGFRRTVPYPHLIQIHSAAVQLLRNYRIAQPGSRKACSFGQGADLNGTGFRSLNFKDTMGNVFLFNKRLICSVKQENSIDSVGIIDP